MPVRQACPDMELAKRLGITTIDADDLQYLIRQEKKSKCELTEQVTWVLSELLCDWPSIVSRVKSLSKHKMIIPGAGCVIQLAFAKKNYEQFFTTTLPKFIPSRAALATQKVSGHNEPDDDPTLGGLISSDGG